MKLNEVFKPLNEDRLTNPASVLEFINKNCKQYVADNPNFNEMPLYRGIQKKSKDPFVLPVDQNRKPVDINIYIQQGIDEHLSKEGFKALRSNSVFSSGGTDLAGDFGYLYEIFPIGDFDFTWSTHITDLASQQNFIFTGLGLKAKDGTIFASNDVRINKKIAEKAGGIIGDFSHVVDYLEYQNTDLQAAIKSDNEIMIHCEKVLYVPKGFLNAPK